MKEKLLSIGKNLFPSDKSKGFFLFLAFFCWEGLFDLLCSAQIMKTKMLLDDAAMESNERKVYVFFFLFIFLTFLSMSSNNEKIGIRVLKTVTAIFPFFFMLVVNFRMWNVFLYGETDTSDLKKAIAPGLLCVLVFIILTFLLYSSIADVRTYERKKGLVCNFLIIIRHPFIWLGWTVLLAQVVLLPQLFMVPVTIYLIPKAQNIMHLLIIYTVVAMTETVIALFVIGRMKSRFDRWSQGFIKRKPTQSLSSQSVPVQPIECTNKEVQITESKSVQGIFGYFSPLYITISVVAVSAFIISLVTIPEREVATGEEAVYASIDELAQEAYNAMYKGQPEKALLISNAVNTRLDGYIYYLRGEKDELKGLYENHKDEPVIAWLYYNQSKDVDSIEQYIITENPYDISFRCLLLSIYPSLKERNMTKEREAYRDELVEECILRGEYNVILPELLSSGNKGKKIADKLEEKYAYLRVTDNVINTVINVNKNGGYSVQIASDIIREAENTPDNAELQYFAAFIGARAASDDSWRYYNGGLNCVKRYLEYLEKDKSLSKLEKTQKKLDCADYMIAMEGYDEAAELLEGITEKEAGNLAETINLMKLSCYESANRGEDCYKSAEKMIEEGQDDMVIWYYYGVGALKDKNPDKMIDAINHVADIMLGKKLSKQDRLVANLLLHTMAEFMIINDGGQYTGYLYSMYDKISDTQKNRLSTFARHYLDAIQFYFIDRNNDSALEEIEAVLKENEELPYAIYLKGIIFYAMNKYEESIVNLNKALEYDPDNTTFMYNLANAYNRANMYEEALAYSNKVSELLPLLNHKDDWYGVSWHNDRLNESIRYYMGR